MKILLILSVLLFGFSLGNNVMIKHNSSLVQSVSHEGSNCHCEVSCSHGNLVQNAYFHASPKTLETNSFVVMLNALSGDVELLVMDDDNYALFRGVKEEVTVAEIDTHSKCESLFLVLSVTTKWHAVSVCRSAEGCKIQLDISDSECSGLSEDECAKTHGCGFCEGLETTDMDLCVPGGPFETEFNIQCRDYTNNYGRSLILIIIGTIFGTVFIGTTITIVSRNVKRRRQLKNRFKHVNKIHRGYGALSTTRPNSGGIGSSPKPICYI